MSAMNDGGPAWPVAEDRYIAIIGESWAAMLGQDRAKYLTPKVGIFLHMENSDLRESMSRMQVISGNVELAMFPLQQILEAMIHRMGESAKYNKAYKPALLAMEGALENVKQADAMLAARAQPSTEGKP